MDQKKPTNPILQAKHWFAEALYDLIRAKSARPELEIALGFPRFERYVKLLREVEWFREKAGLLCYLVSENGEVEILAPNENP
jgi:hypothetical protein